MATNFSSDGFISGSFHLKRIIIHNFDSRPGGSQQCVQLLPKPNLLYKGTTELLILLLAAFKQHSYFYVLLSVILISVYIIDSYLASVQEQNSYIYCISRKILLTCGKQVL